VKDPAFRRASAGSAAPSSIRSDIHDAERLPSTSAPQDPLSLGPPLTLVQEGTRHPSRGFATTIPASDRFFAPCRSRVRGLDPKLHQGLFTLAAKGRAPLVDFCNRYDPRAQLRNRPNPAHHARGRPRTQLSSSHAPRFVFSLGPFGPRSSRTVCQVPGPSAVDLASVVRETKHGWPCFEAQPTEISRARGLRGLAPTRGSPRRDRSRWRLYPNPIHPDTSCRELVVMQVGVACTAGVLVQSTLLRARQRAPLAQDPP
jgi:hypothetical protein